MVMVGSIAKNASLPVKKPSRRLAADSVAADPVAADLQASVLLAAVLPVLAVLHRVEVNVAPAARVVSAARVAPAAIENLENQVSNSPRTKSHNSKTKISTIETLYVPCSSLLKAMTGNRS